MLISRHLQKDKNIINNNKRQYNLPSNEINVTIIMPRQLIMQTQSMREQYSVQGWHYEKITQNLIQITHKKIQRETQIK